MDTMTVPTTIVPQATTLPRIVAGTTSPYPTVVIVAMDHHIEEGIDAKSPSASSDSMAYTRVAHTTEPMPTKKTRTKMPSSESPMLSRTVLMVSEWRAAFASRRTLRSRTMRISRTIRSVLMDPAILSMSCPLLPGQKSPSPCSRYHGIVARTSTRLEIWVMYATQLEVTQMRAKISSVKQPVKASSKKLSSRANISVNFLTVWRIAIRVDAPIRTITP
mmetsp:Transcript_51593/g.160047  ORF Transcript_51593/g.160047 Transcript_51593/m.160047 type:complete len:219 (+) Transcript_51593:712-1368(+)